jgi:antitoxin (DNA-binding transcriptional repressor) of toxin-antitoxin stability system
MPITSIKDAQINLAEWISKLIPGEELFITEHDRIIARLVAEPLPTGKVRQPGSVIGKLTIVEDDDSHLEDFREYMPG